MLSLPRDALPQTELAGIRCEPTGETSFEIAVHISCWCCCHSLCVRVRCPLYRSNRRDSPWRVCAPTNVGTPSITGVIKRTVESKSEKPALNHPLHHYLLTGANSRRCDGTCEAKSQSNVFGDPGRYESRSHVQQKYAHKRVTDRSMTNLTSTPHPNATEI